MDLDHNVIGHRQLSTAVFGMIVLTLGMGIGRFLYTPMLPVMLHEGIFNFSQLSLIASANYAGYRWQPPVLVWYFWWPEEYQNDVNLCCISHRPAYFCDGSSHAP